MRIDEIEFRDKNGNEIEPTKNQLVIYIKSLHQDIKELKEEVKEERENLQQLYSHYEKKPRKNSLKLRRKNMGYRNYFYLVPKNVVNEIKKLDTQKDLANYIVNSNYFKEKEKKEAQKCIDKNDFKEFYTGVYDFGEQLHEFGKLYFDSDTYEAITYNGEDLFKQGSELSEVYEEFEAKIVGKEALIAVAKCYRDKVIKIYEDSLLSPEELKQKYPDNHFPDKRTVFNKLKEDVEEKLFWLKDCLNLDEDNKYTIVNCYLYEYLMFELVHQLKTIDFEKYDIIECGW